MENFETYKLDQTGQQTQAILDQVSTNTADIAQLRALYEALTQSEPVIIQPSDTWPVADPQENVIYRVIDRVNTPPQSYSDYMWNGTAMVLMATYNNSIDNEPTPGSNNLVKSGGVAASIVFDISAYHATGSTLATYANLAAALGTDGANVPASVRKGGMSVKFVQSADNKYVQYRCMAQNFTTDVTQWQGVDDEPVAGGCNLVKAGGITEDIAEICKYRYSVLANGSDRLLPFPIVKGRVIESTTGYSGAFIVKNQDKTLSKRIEHNQLPYTAEFDIYYITAYTEPTSNIYIDIKGEYSRISSEVKNLNEDVFPFSPESTLITGAWVVNSSGEVETNANQNSQYFQVKKGDIIDLSYGEGNTIRWGLFSDVPAIGSIASSKGVNYTEAQVKIENDGYFLYSYYNALTPEVYKSTGIRAEVYVLEKGIQQANNSITTLNYQVIDINTQVKGAIPNGNTINGIWSHGGTIGEQAAQNSFIFQIERGTRVILTGTPGNTLRWGVYASEPQIGSTTDVYGSKVFDGSGVFFLDIDTDGWFVASYYNEDTAFSCNIKKGIILDVEKQSEINEEQGQKIYDLQKQITNYVPNSELIIGIYVNGGVVTSLSAQNSVVFQVKAGDRIFAQTDEGNTIRWGFFEQKPEVGDSTSIYGSFLTSNSFVVPYDGFVMLSYYNGGTIDYHVLSGELSIIEAPIPKREIPQSNEIRADETESLVEVVLTSKNSILRFDKGGSLSLPNIGSACAAFVDFGNNKIGFYEPYANIADKNTTVWKQQDSTYTFVQGHKFLVSLQKAENGDVAILTVTDLYTLESTTMQTLPSECYDCGIAHCWGYDTVETVSGTLTIGAIKLTSLQELYPPLMVIGDSNVDHGGLGANKANAYMRQVKNAHNGNVSIFAQGGAKMSDFAKWYDKFIRFVCKAEYCFISTANDHILNDYVDNVELLISMLKKSHITPILATIHPNGSGTEIEPAQLAINNWIKASGYMYFDIAETVSLNYDSVTVNPDILTPDRVHFTRPVDNALATKFNYEFGYLFGSAD